MAASGACKTLILEREAHPGGIPRHALHSGFGLRDLHRVLSGPTYARRLAENAAAAGAELLTSAMATGWTAAGDLEVTSPQGRTTISPDAVVLCTGCRERSRAARLIAGTRPYGVMTTGTLQQLVYLQRRHVGRRAVIVGAEHVSYSALATLSHARVSVAAILTGLPEHQSYRLFAAGARLRYRTPTLTNTEVVCIHGYPQLEGVTARNLQTAATSEIPCDVLVLTGDWIPDNELAVGAGIAIDRGSASPLVDTSGRTLGPRIFAAGNLVHPAEMADVAALGGRHVAVSVLRSLRTDDSWHSPAAHVVSSDLRWITPQLIPVDRAMPARRRFVVRAREFRPDAEITVTQNDRDLWSGRIRLVPNRSASLPASWLSNALESEGAIEVRVASCSP